jgi:uncharacterized protein (DUF58 family)
MPIADPADTGQFPITSSGWAAAGGGVLLWVLGVRLGWIELQVAGLSMLLTLALAVPFVVGRLRVEPRIGISTHRVIAGQPAIAEVSITGTRRRYLPLAVELPMGHRIRVIRVPAAGAGQQLREFVDVHTTTRGVVQVGPVRSVRADPMGLLRRSMTWPEVLELNVHPATAALARFSPGLLRDLEGRTTRENSTAEVELHTLREYQPGDDRRLVHWRTTARIGTIMVRQFIDTRQSHLSILLSGDYQDYRDEAEYELAVSIFASLGVRALRDGHRTSALVGERVLPTHSGQTLLDGTSHLVYGERAENLTATSTQAMRRFPGTTSVMLVAGSELDRAAWRRALVPWQGRVKVVAFQADQQSKALIRPIAGATLITVPSLDQLPKLIAIAGRQ